MIESEEKRIRLTEKLERWTQHTKVDHLLREGDIHGLVRSILEEFYHIRLCCGHMVEEMDEGVDIEFDDCDGTTSGIYCKDCVPWFVKNAKARVLG